MKHEHLELAIRLGGCVHFCILIASAMVPRVLDWRGRLAVQFFVFDAREFLTTWWLRLGYHALTVVFLALPAPYAMVAMGLGK